MIELEEMLAQLNRRSNKNYYIIINQEGKILLRQNRYIGQHIDLIATETDEEMYKYIYVLNRYLSLDR